MMTKPIDANGTLKACLPSRRRTVIMIILSIVLTLFATNEQRNQIIISTGYIRRLEVVQTGSDNVQSLGFYNVGKKNDVESVTVPKDESINRLEDISQSNNVENPEQQLDRHAVVALVNSDDRSVRDFCSAVVSLHRNNIVKPNSPVIVFHEEDFLDERKDFLIECTNHHVRNPILMFQLVDFSFPPGFDSDREYKTYERVAQIRTKKFNRNLWGYTKMIRFWTSQVWKYPIIQKFESIMRIDTDSCFVEPREKNDLEDQELPGIRGRYVYRTDGVGTGVNTWVSNLFDFAVSYMEKEGIKPRNPELWETIRSSWENEHTLPIFYKNFEVSRVAFFRRSEVAKWHEALADQEPYGVFRYRWSDSNTRVFTMAMFAEADWVLMKKHPGYHHRRESCVKILSTMKENAPNAQPVGQGVQVLDDTKVSQPINQNNIVSNTQLDTPNGPGRPTPDQQSVQIDSTVIPHHGHAVVTLLNHDNRSIRNFCLALQSLHVNEVLKPKNPILVFHEKEFPSNKIDVLQKCTYNPISFHLVQFTFPAGFDASLEYDMNPRVARQGTKFNRKLWGYTQMIRFWTSLVWKHPEVQKLQTVLRIDSDSCFVRPGEKKDTEEEYLPGMHGRYVYRSDGIGTVINDWVTDLYDFAASYMQKENITPRNLKLWESISLIWKNEKALPIFYKKFEVARVSFFTRPDVMKWHDAITDKEPFGVFRYRWSDANTRVLTMAMFADPEWVVLKGHGGYKHGGECMKYFNHLERLNAGHKETKGP